MYGYLEHILVCPGYTFTICVWEAPIYSFIILLDAGWWEWLNEKEIGKGISFWFSPPAVSWEDVGDSGNLFFQADLLFFKKVFDRDLLSSTIPTMRAADSCVLLAAALLLTPIVLAASQEEAEVVANLASLDPILGN